MFGEQTFAQLRTGFRLIRDGEKGGGGGGMEVGEEGDYIYIYIPIATLSPPE